jgi:hypothetical protein
MFELEPYIVLKIVVFRHNLLVITKYIYIRHVHIRGGKKGRVRTSNLRFMRHNPQPIKLSLRDYVGCYIVRILGINLSIAYTRMTIFF